jgi:hypothetical protein
MHLTRKSSNQRGARFATRVAAITLLLIGGFALRGHPVSAAIQGGVAKLANPGTALPLTSGGSATPFTVTLPASAACSGDTATGGYHVFSYLVPKGTSVTTVTFASFPSTGYGFVDNTSTYYGNVNTALTTGQVPSLPTNFAWGPLAETGGGAVPLATLLGGGTTATWEAGIACATAAGAASDWWSTAVTFTASGTDAGGFVWTTGATAPASTTTIKPAGTTTTKPPKTTTTLGQQATPTTGAAGETSTTVAGGTTTTLFGSTPTTAYVAGAGTGTGTDGFVDPIASDSSGTLPRTGSPIHRDMGLGLFAIGTGMMLIGIDLRWKARGALAS